MRLGWYNGWSPAERMAVIPAQREAVRTGKIPRPSHCSICGTAHARGGSNPVWLHDEDYADPLAAYPICRRCHLVLHERFGTPESWEALVAHHASTDGHQWYERLTLDPASLRQPFAMIYPEGLPGPISRSRSAVPSAPGVPDA